MSGNLEANNDQYGQTGLSKIILDAFKLDGKDIDNLSIDDLSQFDQLHYGGVESTRDLANMAKLESGLKILDVGSGVGGPARTLSSEFGCEVIGIDITQEYVNVANMLSELVKLESSTSFQQGDALKLDFPDDKFDVVWSQNAIMNIENKKQVFAEMARVLKPNGTLALEAIMGGSKKGTVFPVYWANTQKVNFISTPEVINSLIRDVGFTETEMRDVTAGNIKMSREQVANAHKPTPAIGLHLLYSDVSEKTRNTLAEMENGVYLNIYSIYEKL